MKLSRGDIVIANLESVSKGSISGEMPHSAGRKRKAEWKYWEKQKENRIMARDEQNYNIFKKVFG